MSNAAKAAAKTAPRSPRPIERTRRIEYGDPTYFKVMDFVIQEALLLDDDRLDEWRRLLDDDIFYYMSQQRTLARGSERYDSGSYWYYENLPSLDLRIRKLLTAKSAFAENPPSRIRRFVSNLSLFETTTPGEYLAQSYLLLMRNRGDQSNYDQISCVRDDLLRRRGDGWTLGQRHIMVDQAVLGTHNLSFFL